MTEIFINIGFVQKQGIKHLVIMSPEKRPPIHTSLDMECTEIVVEELWSPAVRINKEVYGY